MSGTRTEIAAGALTVLAAAGFLAYAVQTAGRGGAGPGTYPLTASFRSAQGVGPGADVRLAGVRIGRVTEMALDPRSYRAELTFAIDAGIELPEDSAVSVASDGLLGGAFVEIEAGDSPFTLQPGAEILDTRGARSLLGLLSQGISAAADR